MPESKSSNSLFPPTSWTAIETTRKSLGLSVEPLDRLIRIYHRPLVIYLKAAFPSVAGEAERYVTEFAEDKIATARWLDRADPGRGHFRDFLKVSLRNYVLDQLSRSDALRHCAPLEEIDNTGPQRAADAFDQEFIRTFLTTLLANMETDCRRADREQPRWTHIWEIFRMRLIEPHLAGETVPGYDELVQRFALRSPSEASNMLLSAKRLYERHYLQLVADYAGKGPAARAEIEALDAVVRRMSGPGY